MAEFPALPLWTDAYLADTTHLTATEHGAYLLLLMAMWRSPGCRLANDPELLARYAKVTRGQWGRMSETIMKFFTASDGYITQGRLTDEYGFVRRNSIKQSNNAKSRWLKNNVLENATALPEACQLDAPTPTPTPIEEKKEEDTPNGASSSKYFFEAGPIRLTEKDFKKWEQDYPLLSLRAELNSLADWADIKPPQKWFFPVANALAKRNREIGVRIKTNSPSEIERKPGVRG